ncbi:hypothetical protein HII17_06875 [Thalassotalea sp. M1531]|uniref:Uncharacterized protein n=1 Tax=Thalassotalea algicola TaxID=2716224 RepID=A0A7Y0Q5S3_9GAMM|nr:hypothetical protein [Thalassotalea algicola]NMP31279.1 hypothetical protein [Thalassotalea algicola]
MTNFTRFTVLILLIVVAIICYGVGSSSGMALFFILGACFELAFWFGIFSSNEELGERSK